MVTLEERLKDPDYKSWVKAALCVQIVKEGLETFADDKSKELHNNVLSHVPAGHTICPAACTDPLKNIKKCCHNCSAYLTSLESYRSSRAFIFCKDQFNNTEVANWHTEPWQMAKLFMNRGQAKASIKASETDLSGILNFIGRCSVPLNDVQNKTNIDEVRKERNAILHTSNMLLTEADFLHKTQPMLDLLNDPNVIATLPAAQNAADRIIKVRDKSFKINLDDETGAIKAMVAEIRTLRDDLLGKVAELEEFEGNTTRLIENCKTVTDKQQEAITRVVDGINEVKQRHEELSVLCNVVQAAHIEDNQQLQKIVKHHKIDLNNLHERISKLNKLESRFGRLEVSVREHDLQINELKEENCKRMLKTLCIERETTQSDDPDDDQVAKNDLTMRVEVSDDEYSLSMVRLIKYYPVLKSEMDRPETQRIAARLLDEDRWRELFVEKQRRRIAVDKLLKHVLRTEDTVLFFKLLEQHWKPSRETQEELSQLEATKTDVKDYRDIKVHHSSQWKFEDDDRKELRFTIKDFTTIDKLNNWFLSRFFFRTFEHDEVIEKLLLSDGDGVDCLFDTMYKCDKRIMRCFCETLECHCSDISKVVGRLDLRKKYCDLASKVREDGNFQRFVRGPLRRLFSYCERLGFTVDRTEVGSLVLYLSANTESAWEELKHKFKSGEIVELLHTLDTDAQILKACFEEGDCIRITVYSLEDKSGVPKAILRLDRKDELVNDRSEANPIKRNMDLLCEELEINDSLIDKLCKLDLVPGHIRELLEKQQSRASKIRCLMENISSPEKGFTVLQDYCNDYLFAQLEISSEEYRNTNVLFTCEAILEPYTSGQLIDDELKSNPIKRNMDVLCEELEICDSLIEELKEQKLVADNIRKLLKEQRARASKIRCLMENISPPEKGFTALKDYIKRCNTYLFEQLEINSVDYTSASGLVRLQWVVKSKKFYDTELKQSKLLYTRSHGVKPESNLDPVPVITNIDSEDTEHQPKKTLGCPKPGKPATEDVKPDSVTIHWASPTTLGEWNYYQIRYKEDRKNQWAYPDRESVTIRNLRADTTYTFQVRAVTFDGEAKCSLKSDEIRTKTSMASRLLQHSLKLKDGHPAIYQLANTVVHTFGGFGPNVFEIGYPSKCDHTEKTILLIGATGSGKSTMVDAITNYVTGVHFGDPYRLRLVEHSDRLRPIGHRFVGTSVIRNIGWMQKKQVFTRSRLWEAMPLDYWDDTTCYIINPEEGSRLNYRLNIIDTHISITRPQLNRLLHRFEAERHSIFVCLLIPAGIASTAQQEVYMNEILRVFDSNEDRNMCTMITFADSNEATAKEQSNEHCYVFNNSCLFESTEKMSSMLWDMNKLSFEQFFNWIQLIPTCTCVWDEFGTFSMLNEELRKAEEGRGSKDILDAFGPEKRSIFIEDPLKAKEEKRSKDISDVFGHEKRSIFTEDLLKAKEENRDTDELVTFSSGLEKLSIIDEEPLKAHEEKGSKETKCADLVHLQ